MQAYFLKATYTNNVYKIGDFFLSGNYKLDSGKELDINFKPSDGQTIFTTSQLIFTDTTDIREMTHFIVPDYDKIYKIESVEYRNAQQYDIICNEDPLIGNYQELKDTDIILQRTNNISLWRGTHDISDLNLKETVETKTIESVSRTGKWALLFMQVDTSKSRLGLKFKQYNASLGYEQFSTLADIITAYPEIDTEEPSKIDYYQKKVFSIGGLKAYQCTYYESSGVGKLYWAEYEEFLGIKDFYFDIDDAIGVRPVESDIRNVIIALPFETVIMEDNTGTGPYLISWNRFVGPIDSGELIDIKIVDDILLPFTGCDWNINTTTRTMKKELEFPFLSCVYLDLFADSTTATVDTNYQMLAIVQNVEIIDLNPAYYVGTPSPYSAEPFNKYELYIFGQRFSIPYYLAEKMKMLIAINSGVINYSLYYDDKRNIIAAGSFTNSAKYQVDQLDAFYNQNPTYKDQFYLKMGGNAFKTVAGGAVAGGMGGPLGVAGGASIGAITAGVDAGLTYANFKYMEKGLMLKPDQIFGDVSDTALSLKNIFAIYWVKKTPENRDLMLNEYYLRGFPTSYVESIDDLTDASNGLFGACKIVFGELKNVIRNEYTTKFINEKLKEGIILVP